MGAQRTNIDRRGRLDGRAEIRVAYVQAGVTGLPGVQISNQLSNSINGSVLVSNDKNLHLDSGTQMVLRVVSQ